MSAKRRPGPVTIRRIGSDEPSVTVAATDLTHPVRLLDDEPTEPEFQPTQSDDELRLLVSRPPNATMAARETGDGHGDYTSLRYKAMRGEPEAVADRHLAVFAETAHDNDDDRADARVKRENGTLRCCTQTYGDKFTKLRDALHNAEALPNPDRSLSLARRIAHDLEKLVESLT